MNEFNDLRDAVTALQVSNAELKTTLAQQARALEKLEEAVSDLTEIAHRWRGAFLILLGLGSFIGLGADAILRKLFG